MSDVTVRTLILGSETHNKPIDDDVVKADGKIASRLQFVTGVTKNMADTRVTENSCCLLSLFEERQSVKMISRWKTSQKAPF